MFTAKNIQKNVYWVFAVFVVAYIAIGLFGPMDQKVLDTYNISALQLRVFTLPLLAMITGIWACTAYGFAHFKHYALLIKKTPEGSGINTIANSLGLFAFQLVLSGIFSTAASFESVKRAVGGESGALLISTYFGVFVSLITFFLVKQGATQLITTIEGKKHAFRQNPWVLFCLFVVSAIYIGFMAASYPTTGTAESVYKHMPFLTALFTLGLPNLVTWFFAVSAAQMLSFYRLHVDGVIYSSAMNTLARGLYIIVGGSILSQILGTVGDSFENLTLAPLLVIVYLLVVAIGVGFLYIAQSAKKLRLIEEI